MEALSCQIPAQAQDYEVVIGHQILSLQIPYFKTLASQFAIITDDHIAPLYGQSLKEAMSAVGLNADLFVFPHGEEHKTRATKERLENQLFEKGWGRDTCIIALGGGVVTDLGGYIAATYCRGVPLVMVPTSLLGMVDASIGGKTGVNVPYGKNMLGCIYQPKKVIIDLATLSSLPKNEMGNGVVEMIKHALIADEGVFEVLESHCDQLLALEPPVLEKMISESCRIKKQIVEEDEKETGKRHLLNFGHTVGHALEHCSLYSLFHGEAVAIGIMVESYLSVQLGLLDAQSLEKIKRVLVQYAVPLRLPDQLPMQKLQEAMKLDKKSAQGRPRFVMLEAIGTPRTDGAHYCFHVEESLIKRALQWMYDDLCCH